MFHIRSTRSPNVRRVASIVAAAGFAVLVLASPSVAHASAGDGPYLAANSLPVVITNLRNLIMGLLAGIATLFLVLAGVYWATAGGDPGQVDKAKSALRNALVGYGLAVLAPVLLQLMQGVVGG
ncbi:pilin [Verrucosispora sp. WMMC514]|uniref:pilin n=1 Tax=Verrucosispora sp. WMMC514 TaxID=3015156 RepID=UPI00248B6991|nr:pilin [Verrucosispora sp. WMMC514]WBB93386.1 pilin [Verrucosispora sp. WMMC514]